MAMVTKSARATVSDLYKAPGKAELVNGELVLMPPTGIDPGYAAGEIFASLREHVRRTRRGRAFTDNAGFLVVPLHRQSFRPDPAYCNDDQRGMKFHRGAPRFAAEVRSESDYGAAAEGAMAAKRTDYFAAGTEVVWDVDLLSEAMVRVYRCDSPESPAVYRRDDRAEAEPAVPGWSMAVNDLFVD